MKILLTAFACDPTRGSDAGVGWRWAETLATKGHDVWVLTRTAYRENIEKELAGCPVSEKLNFLYYEKEAAANVIHRAFGGLHLYYYLWQLGAYHLAKSVHRREAFDLVHHVTWVSARLPSFMGNLGIPFVFGPAAGGESAPLRLRVGYGLRTWIAEGVRDISNLFVKLDPMMRRTFSQAARIYVTSAQTGAMVPESAQNKVRIQLAIAADEPEAMAEDVVHKMTGNFRPANPFRILYVGRFLELKGMHLGFPAFAQLLRERPTARLTLVGSGPAERRWREMAETLGIARNIDWVSWVERSQLQEFYSSHDAFFFPSLHDSGGMVVLEAMSHGLPVVCLDVGGPGILVDGSCGFSIRTSAQTKKRVIDSLARALVALEQDDVRADLRRGARMRVRQFTWAELVSKVYSEH